MDYKKDQDERPRPEFDLAQLRRDYGLAEDTPWQIVRDYALDDGYPLTAQCITEWHELDAPNAWVSCGVLEVGDYGGAGDVGEANIRALKRHYDDQQEQWWEERSYYGHKKLWLLDTEDNRAIVKDLEEQYPVFDENVLSQVQDEWEQEAWNDYGWADMKREVRDLYDCTEEIERWEEEVDEQTDQWRLQCYYEARCEAEAYPTFEYNGAALLLDRMAEEFYEVTQRKLHPRIQHHPDQQLLPGM